VACVEATEAAGWQVVLPSGHVCCGRPLYDYGFLDTAERYLHRVLDVLREDIRAGTPVVGMEPSCLAVFRDELVGLFPDDADAQRLHAQSLLLSEFLTKHAPDWPVPQLRRTALVQPHCHHHAVCGFDDEAGLLQRMGLDVQQPDAGCCGMAGSFGYEAGERYEVSVAVGERVLLPAVRAARDDTVLIADGFSCRSQIAQLTDRRPLHLAQVLRLAVRDGAAGPAGRRPEEEPERSSSDGTRSSRVPVAVGAAALAAALSAAVGRRRSHDWRNTR
jgi:Fe-S oxidoreductase